MARRLAAVPELFAVAAEQYLPVIDAVDDAAERRQVVGLLRRAADQAALTGDYALVNALLAAALRLDRPGARRPRWSRCTPAATPRSTAWGAWRRRTRNTGRSSGCALPRWSARDATAVQVHSLTHRNRFAEAVGLGLDSLRELGITVPAADRLPAELDHQFGYLYRWLDQTDGADDLARPDISDPTLLAASASDRARSCRRPTPYRTPPWSRG